jgi:hypothetical protein
MCQTAVERPYTERPSPAPLEFLVEEALLGQYAFALYHNFGNSRKLWDRAFFVLKLALVEGD